MTIRKRCLLWDWTNTQGCPGEMDKVRFNGPIKSVVNWNTWIPPELKGRAPFYPQIHDPAKLSGDDWARIENTKDDIILFFNEPERIPVSAQEAADIWFKQIVPLRKKGNRLVSPSCASDPKGQAWIAEFMRLVERDPPDFLGVHYYGTDHQAAIKFLEEIHTRHPKQKLFVSETASIARNYHDVLTFTVEVANFMDKAEWVEAYGFFGCMRSCADGFVSPEAQLMKPDGHFTDLMYKLMYDQPMKV